MKTKEQLAEDKFIAMKYRLKPLKVDESMKTNELKKVVNELWANIVQLESDKYDLQEEQRRQEYHLKELLERQKQINKNKAVKMGLDTEDLNVNIPPKVRLASKYERKVDRRSFREKTSLFDGGYIEQITEKQERQWEDKVNHFKEGHADKHVAKWDPSAPRKEIYEPGTIIYEDSDEEDTDLVDKLRSYVDEAQQERRASLQRQQSQQSSVAQPADRDLINRRRSSQLSQSSVGSKVSSAQQQQRQSQASIQRAPVQAAKSQQEDEDEYEDEEYEEEEYTDEEVEE